MAGHLWLIGMMGSGKTSVGRSVAARLGAGFVDTDAEVARRTGCSIAQLWGARGEAAFRVMESAAVAEVADGAPAVVATGGGVVLDPGNVAVMRRTGLVVWLSAEPETLSERVGRDSVRPLLHDDSSPVRLAGLLEQRSSLYVAAAHHIVDTEALSVEAIAERIEELWTESS